MDLATGEGLPVEQHVDEPVKTEALRVWWRRLPAFLAFALLAAQMAVPWTVPLYVTPDGSSHLYSGVITRDLLLHHSTSPYSTFYTIQRGVVPNWTGSLVFGAASALVGAAHAEQLVTSFAILLGFLGFCYANHALNPGVSPWTPLANVLYQTWFLFIGFYNFYLGMALLPFVLGYYLRHAGRLRAWQANVLAVGLIAMFCTHLIPAAICVMAVVTVAVWVNLAGRRRRNLRDLSLVAGACLPVAILALVFVANASGRMPFTPGTMEAWKKFPMHVFHIAPGYLGEQKPVWVLVLCLMTLAALVLRRPEWRSAQGALVMATLLAFGGYLLVPDRGFGGSEAKIRFSWAVFVLGGLLVCAASRLRFLQVPVALYVAWFLAGNIATSVGTTRAVAAVSSDYLSAARVIPPRATFVRLRYPAPGAPEKYGYVGAARDPLFHLDALVAALNQSVNLSDYQAPSQVFPVILREKRVERGIQYALWGFEGPDKGTPSSLAWVNANIPAPLDYVLVSGDVTAPESIRQGMPEMLASLDANMDLVAVSPGRLVRVYRRR